LVIRSIHWFNLDVGHRIVKYLRTEVINLPASYFHQSKGINVTIYGIKTRFKVTFKVTFKVRFKTRPKALLNSTLITLALVNKFFPKAEA
jgi:hypothetical protein